MADTPRDELQELVELERAQIGHEIHDALLPLIFAAASGVESAIEKCRDDSAKTEELLRQVSQWLAEAMLTGRHLLTGIYPPEMTATLWARAAKDTLDRLFATSECEISWRCEGDVQETSLPTAIAAYRIIVEAVRNAIRHGRAKEVLVSATKHAATIEIVVQDNGSGFDPTNLPPDRFGIRSMTGRAKLVGGTLEIKSQPGGPTTLSVALPNAADESAEP